MKAQLVPWIVGGSGFWGGVNLKNQSPDSTTVRITESNEAGDILSTRDIPIGPWRNHGWAVANGTRTVLIEGPDSVYVTANQGQDGAAGVTSLPIYTVPSLKN